MADQRIDIVVTSKVKDALAGLGRVASSAANLTKVGLGIAAVGIVSGGVAAIKAAANYETLNLRLEAVTGSAEKANKIFAETRKFAAATPLALGDLVDARILLEGIGVSGQDALEKVAGAAAAMNKPMIEVASIVASLETEPLRRLGIEIKRVGDQANFSFRDKMGKQIKLVTQGIDEARTALLGIFSTKFGGFLEKASLSFSGLASTLKDNLTDAFASLGEGLLPAAKMFVAKITEGLGSLISSGLLQNIGQKIGSTIALVFTTEGRSALGQYLSGVFETLTNRMEEIFSRFIEDFSRATKAALFSFAGEVAGAFDIDRGAMLKDYAELLRQPMARVSISRMYPFPSINETIKNGSSVTGPTSVESVAFSKFISRGSINGRSLGYDYAGSAMAPANVFGNGINSRTGVGADGREYLITRGESAIVKAIDNLGQNIMRMQPVAVAQ